MFALGWAEAEQLSGLAMVGTAKRMCMVALQIATVTEDLSVKNTIKPLADWFHARA
jgi:hypothetical protein